MLDILAFITKYGVVFVCNYYVFAKLCASKLKIWDFLFIPVYFSLAFGLYYVSLYAKFFIPIIILLVSILLCFARYRQPFSDTVSLSMVAFGVTIFIMVIASIPSAVALVPVLAFGSRELVMTVNNFVYPALHLALVIVAFHTKRLKNSLTPTRGDEVFQKLLLSSVVCIFSMTLFYTVDKLDAALKVIAAIAVFCGLVFLTQWRKTVTSGYYKILERRRMQRLEMILEQYGRERKELLTRNGELAKIIHRDNKLLPAMRVAVGTLTQKYSDDDSVKTLSKTLDSVYSERNFAIENYANTPSEGARSGILSIDSVMDYFKSRAAKGNVKFDFRFSQTASNQLLKIFGEPAPLNEMLCDLAENALIAVRGQESGKVFLTVGEENGTPCIKVFDSGAPFEEKVLRNMGRRNVTTHAHEGGSGIGLMTLFDTLRSFHASYLLDETEQNGFNKCVCITFDQKDGYAVKSSRPCVRKVCAERENFLFIEIP